MKKIKLGIIGLSPGNGHPYSWAAICNGYNKMYMDTCPFPVIPQYLYKQSYPEDFINQAKVTHIWCQDKKIAVHIAKASNIENVVDSYLEMIGEVDGILLARDDAENHLSMSRAFIEAGLPIYIDKPLAFGIDVAKQIYALEKYDGQIFSCSAMRYSKEVQSAMNDIDTIGEIRYIDACVMKKWSTYAAHIIDPVLFLMGKQGSINQISKQNNENMNIVQLQWESGLITTFSSHKKTPCPIVIRIFGDKGYKEIIPSDTFYAFRETLKTFIRSIHEKELIGNKNNVLKMVEIIEKGI